MKVTSEHWLSDTQRDLIAGGSPMSIRRFLVIHFTAGWGARTSIAFWRTPAARGANAHLVIDRDGTVIQCRPFNRSCGHAGISSWVDPKTGIRYTGLNSCSIGIELANCGNLARELYPSTCGPDFAGKPIPRLTARHKNGGPEKQWEIYPLAQFAACEAAAKAIVARYNLDDVIGHEDCSPGRKTDPGPAFPMADLRVACGFPPEPRR